MNPVLTIPMVRCVRCKKIDTATVSICPSCLCFDLEPYAVPGVGKVVSWTTIRRAPERFRDEAPYEICVVDLDSGQRVTGRLTPTQGIQIGARVGALSTRGSTPVFQITFT